MTIKDPDIGIMCSKHIFPKHTKDKFFRLNELGHKIKNGIQHYQYIPHGWLEEYNKLILNLEEAE